MEPFTLEHFEDWASRLILDNGDPWRLEPFQAQFVADLFEGRPENWWILPEGNGKSTAIAGVALYGLKFAPDALIPIAASTRDQARIIYRQMKGFIRRSGLIEPDTDGTWFEPFDGYRRIDLRAPGKTKRGEVIGTIEIHAADAGSGDGVIPYPFAFIDELHRHKDLELYSTWRGKLLKRGAQEVIISTAGEFGGEFEETREKIRQETPTVERRPGFVRASSEGVLFHEWSLEEGADPEDMEAVKRCNPLSTITPDALRKKRNSPTMSPQHWGRFVCNLPMRAGNAAISEAEWYSAYSGEQIPTDAEVWIGADFGWRHDTTAFVPLWWKEDDFRLFGPAVVIEPPGDGNSQHPEVVKRAFTDLQSRYKVTTVVMDMSRDVDIAHWISDLGILVIDRAQTNKPFKEDYERFMAALRQGWLFHSGDQGLKRHALNAVTRLLPDGGVKFARRDESRDGNQEMKVIDALVAAAMVHSYADEVNSQPAAEILVAWA